MRVEEVGRRGLIQTSGSKKTVSKGAGCTYDVQVKAPLSRQSDLLNEKLKAHQMKDNGLAVELDRHPPLVLPAEDFVLSDIAASCPPRSIAAPSSSGGTSWEPREELDRPYEGLMDPFDVGPCQRYEYGVSQEESGPRLEQRRAIGKGRGAYVEQRWRGQRPGRRSRRARRACTPTRARSDCLSFGVASQTVGSKEKGVVTRRRRG